MTTDPISLLSRGLEQAGNVIDGVRPEQADLPTPCHSWTVRQLIEHIVYDFEQFTVMAQGEPAGWSQPSKPVGDDWSGAHRAGAEQLLNAWRRAGDLTGTRTLPGMGELPARFQVDMQVAEFAVHAWDLARATGQRVELDPEVAEAALAWMRGAMAPEYRGGEADGKAFGPEVPIAEDAPAYDRLAAFAGRDPAFR